MGCLRNKIPVSVFYRGNKICVVASRLLTGGCVNDRNDTSVEVLQFNTPN